MRFERRRSSAVASGNLLTLTVPVNFLASFNGNKSVFMSATSAFGATGGK